MIQNINKCGQTSYTIGNKCKKSVGGIKEMYYVPKEGIEYFHYDVEETDMIDYILLKDNAQFQSIEFLHDSGSITTTYTYDPNTGNANYKTEIKGNISNYDNMWNLGHDVEGGEYVVVYKDMNDYYYIVGLNNPVEVTNYTQTTGANLGEFNGYEVTFTCDDSEDVLRCVVGDEMKADVGSTYFIPETILKGLTGMSWRSVEEIDWGNPDVDFPYAQDTEVNYSPSFPIYFGIQRSQETEPLFPELTQGLNCGYAITDAGIDHYAENSEVTITNPIVRFIIDMVDETGEGKSFTKKMKSYYMMGDNTTPDGIWIVFVGTDEPLAKFNISDRNFRPNGARCAVIDWEFEWKMSSTKEPELVFKINSFEWVSYSI